MERKKIIAEIRQYVQKISQISHMIETYGHDHPQVELELLQKNITQLFESYVRLRITYETSHEIPAAKKDIHAAQDVISFKKPEIPAQQPVEDSSGQEEEKKAQLGFTFEIPALKEPSSPAKEEIDFSLKSKDSPSIFNLDKAIEEASDIKIGEQKKPFKPEIKNAADDEAEQKELSINDRFSGTKDLNLASKHLSTPITDLTKEISLNKKFGFINELFKGNMEQYHQAILKLNTAGSWDKARALLTEYHEKMEWDAEESIVEDFVELVKRRWS
jgi:hypothetical protein